MTDPRITAFVEAEKQEQLELLRTLCKIPAPSLHEEKRTAFVRDFFCRLLQEEKAEDRCEVAVGEEGNVTLLIPGKRKELLVYSAHLDTVFPDTEPMEMREEGTRLFCPGAGDDSANLVNLLLLAKYALQKRKIPEYSLLFAATVGEEGFGNLAGSRALYETCKNRILAFTSFDLYIPQCTGTAVGSWRCRIRVKTKGGHSYHDFGSPSAIEYLCRLIGMLGNIERPTMAKTTYNIGRIGGGTSVNTIAQDAFCLYEYRSERQDCLRVMQERFREVIGKTKDWPCEVSVEELGFRPANAENADFEALRAFTKCNGEAVREVTGKAPVDEPISSDANIFLSHGIPANTLGTIRGGGAHTRGEWVDLSSLPTGLALAITVMEKQEAYFL